MHICTKYQDILRCLRIGRRLGGSIDGFGAENGEKVSTDRFVESNPLIPTFDIVFLPLINVPAHYVAD